MELKPRSIGAWAAALALIAALTAAFATSPVAEPLSDTPSPAPSAPLTWCWPVEGSYPISSPFYLSRIHPVTQTVVSHPGVDIAAPARTHVLAAADGTADTGFDSSRGFWVLLEHPDGHSTLYTHLAEVLVSAGDQVCAGSTLGTVGSTGRSTGPHLHFELWDSQGSPLDPMDLFS